MRNWLIGLVIVAVLVVVGFYVSGIGRETFPAMASPAPAVETVRANATPANAAILVDGSLVPVRYASLSLPVDGMVSQVPVMEGDVVAAGDLLVGLDNERQRIAVTRAESELAQAQARLDELMAGSPPEEIAAAQAVVDGAKAERQRLLDGPQEAEIAGAEAGVAAAKAQLLQVLEGADETQLIEARANLGSAEAELQRAQRAYNQIEWRNDAGATLEAADLERATHAYEAAKARYDLLLKGARDSQIAAAQALVDQAQAALDRLLAPPTQAEIDAAEAKVRRAEALLAERHAGPQPAAVQAAQADVKRAAATLLLTQTGLDEMELRAPFTGTVAALDARVGEQVKAGATLVRLADQSTWLVKTADLTEIDVVNVQPGDAASVTVDALPDLDLTGTVTRIRPLGENKNGDITYTAIIQLDQQDERLRWNMTASVAILTR
jgi:multidrug resistance efflux pump